MINYKNISIILTIIILTIVVVFGIIKYRDISGNTYIVGSDNSVGDTKATLDTFPKKEDISKVDYCETYASLSFKDKKMLSDNIVQNINKYLLSAEERYVIHTSVINRKIYKQNGSNILFVDSGSNESSSFETMTVFLPSGYVYVKNTTKYFDMAKLRGDTSKDYDPKNSEVVVQSEEVTEYIFINKMLCDVHIDGKEVEKNNNTYNVKYQDVVDFDRKYETK